tara:strand:+ start:210 stop:524 length:315 start_codon:yes stop_codon:yes gene_type:complete
MTDSFLRDHQPAIDHMHEENAINDLKNAGIYPDPDDKALEPTYLTEDEYAWLNEAVSYWRENCKDVCDDIDNEGTNLHDVLERLQDIVVTPQNTQDCEDSEDYE